MSNLTHDGTSATMSVSTANVEEQVKITEARVSAKLSHNFNNWEIVLGATKESGFTREDVNSLRKEAQILADEAVRQYKVAQEEAGKVLTYNKEEIRNQFENIKKIPRRQWSEQMKATVIAWNEHCYRSEQPYSYDDDWGKPAEDEDYYDDKYEDEIPC